MKIVGIGDGGSNGRAGALFVSPTSGRNGSAGPKVNYTNSTPISTTDQTGVEAGSVGGKGGNGGNSYLSFWDGRDGGDGGAGGTVNVTNNTGVQAATTGKDKHGIFASSRSGQAGNGGSGFAAPGGGTGGHSSNGGNVTVTNQGNIITKGEGAFGIYGLSVSNNGGNGGSQWGLVGQSGSGGFGGSGGPVSITNTSTGTINTSGGFAHGVLAQSIGGTGGSSGTSGDLFVSLLGNVDNGGNGGQVSVINNGKIITTGDNARGIFAQSIGGGGGSGGSAGGLIAIGGAGSNGGNSNTVTVINNSSGSIATTGIKSDGIFAQSVGGSGGSGSNAGGLVAIGGSGSKAGDGGAVTVENYGTISTTKNGARGVVAQSIGGGGGDGGNSRGFVAVGGSGDGGGKAAIVTIKQGGVITTAGADSIGILAQSVGGGGGNGGSSGSVSAFVGVAVGGSGSKGGTGGNVDVTLQGQDANTASVIRTTRDRSTGLFAQSVGGGGGLGGGAVQVTGGFGGAASFAVGGQGGKGGDGGVVTLSKGTGLSIVETAGNDATGVMLQSVGGGGGNGGYAVSVSAAGGPVSGSLSVAIGGNGGTAGTGGKVTVGDFDSTGALLSTGFNGSIVTTGERSTGLFAQSVGGGGGNGGLAVSAAVGGSLFFSGSIGIGLGGSGSGGGDGGTVSVGTQGNITTEKASSTGLLVQSVGGGGGNGGGSIAASLAGSGGGAGTIGVAIGGNADKGGQGGQVMAATRAGTITTSGDHSTAIVVQSIGGGGGTGGYSISAGGAGAGGGAGAINVGLGGTGGGGGGGGTVKADLQSSVKTSSQNSTGILVQSVGGGGGNGGYTVAAGIGGAGVGSGAVSVGLGGQGGTGGIGGTVTATSTGAIATQGDRSTGFVAQSIGGGGGNGGFNVSAGIAGAGTGSGTANIGLGGKGGSGNNGGAVTATVVGSVITKGNESGGLLAQSVGGGGGNGGFNVSGGIAGAGTGSGAISVGLGGGGGSAGDGRTVTLTAQNEVSTGGKNSTAVVAQSIGGGGGNGGFNVSGSGSGAGVGGAAISVGLGGSGAGGGNGGAVVAATQRKIETSGDQSGGILAQSVGGGGGNGGFNVSAALSGAGTGSGAIAVGLGGSGAGGGNGSTVDLTVTNNVTTGGKKASGIVAQSVGGGGGNGGFDVSAALSGGGTGSGAIAVGLGGSAGTGGTGNAVTSKVTGNLVTSGDQSSGLLVQSVGGGGGNGGFSVSGAVSGAGNGSVSAAIGIGGSGGSGGNSIGKVTSSLTGDVQTTGTDSTGVIVQSVGGGGGNGGLAIAGAISGAKTGSGAVSVGIGGSGGGGGRSSEVDNTVIGNISATQNGSGGVLAQSLGGGGGNGGISVNGAISLAGTGSGAVSVGIGGSGGTGGTAAKVTNRVTGIVNTDGANGSGVTAQSIGGGGGNGGLNVTGTISAAKTGAGAVGIGIGGVGGGGGNAADVDNTVTGYVQTAGNNAIGSLAQSLGGGGGNGGLNVTGAITAAKDGSGNIAVGVGGFGGAGGDGKNVLNKVTSGVLTKGDDSNGIVAQSLGGGGGNGSLNVTGAINLSKDNGGAVGVGIGGFGGTGGNAGTVTSRVTTTADHNQIATQGNNSSAVVAQSIGGGGGSGGLNVTGAVNLTGKNGASIGVGVGGFGGGAGNAGDVTLGVTGPVVTQGNNSNGLLAQSIGGGGGNGGTNVTGALAFTNSTGGSSKTVAASLGVGGFGGNAGNAGAVDVTYSGTIVTPGALVPAATDPKTEKVTPAHFNFKEGTGSHGIAAQSIGGGGGNGGIDVSAGISYARGSGDAYGILVGVGGFGGKGGSADKVNVMVNGGESISSYGAGHSAILAQSIGGGGGNGGTNVSGGIVSDSPLIVGVGGFGGNAGVAKNVSVTAKTNVFASTADPKNLSSAGILAQSLGGGGGNGGLNVSGGIAINKGRLPSLTVGIGGFGGAGSISGDVTVNHVGNTITSGNWVHGILAQSIAGGGGNGGLNVSGEINAAAFRNSTNSGGKTDLTIVAGVGGTGGTGADAGNVSVIDAGTVTTKGDNARGVAAQSIGGGGGTGGLNVTAVVAQTSSPISVGVGGTGGSGGNAGTTAVNRGTAAATTGKVTTTGNGAYGIEASSIGGGGGDAGMNFIVGKTFAGRGDSAPGFAATFTIGGGGGAAGDGNTSQVTNFSDIETNQDNSHGLLAQSIGGGGGNASFNLAVIEEQQFAGQKNMGFNLTIGGATGDGGHGGKVNVIQSGKIETHGGNSMGILAQSIGGGGGNAGMDVGYTRTAGGKMGITIGRNGGTGGFGSDVTLSAKGSIITHGDGSYGMLAQSLGNGGGNSSSTSVTAETAGTEADPAQAASLAVGLEGGLGGRGGNVTLDADGLVSTKGKNAHAIFAQSVGGGGGNGGSANTFGLSAATAALSLGGTGGQGGIGGTVKVTSSANVRTSNTDSVGILAQSIGGGGGTGGMARSGGVKSKVAGVTVSVGGNGGAGMAGGIVTAKNSGVIITDGDGAHGVLAQSLGGGGGNSGMAINEILQDAAKDPTNRLAITVGGTGGDGAVSGDVTITNTGGIGTNQSNSVGLFAQSIGGGGGNSKNVITSSVSGDGGGNTFSMGIGGTGGTGASAGGVSVFNQKGTPANSGQIITLGNYSYGILAMSVGGGGGTGSTTITTQKAPGAAASSTTHAYAFSLGGAGGTGGTGGIVNVENKGTITTYGYKAHGILAESVGGGGGTGGMSITGDMAMGAKTTDAPSGNVGSMALGGVGGNGNKSGNVTVKNSGSIEVFGQGAYGIYAQSVGGGGGNGGFTATLSRNILSNPKTDLQKSLMNIGVGGNGGNGADSGNVLVQHNGSITSHGNNSYGIFAQSVSGGGGNVGHSITSPAWMAADLAISTLVGGRNGAKGIAGTVTLNTSGNINMLGKNSTAQLGQSVNGGGGNVNLFLDVSKQAAALDNNGNPLPNPGGDIGFVKAGIQSIITLGSTTVKNAVGSGIDATHVGDLYTSGKNSLGSLMQSIGGGGGNVMSEVVVDSNAKVDLALELGAKDTNDSSGGDITLNRVGNVIASGNQSQGVSVQSVGGGGGRLLIDTKTASTANNQSPGSTNSTATVTLGADPSFNNNGGALHLNLTGNTVTNSDYSPGLVLQSIGAGGGQAYLLGLKSATVKIGASDGSTGNGGDIQISNTGAIVTAGKRSDGIVLQSIGGGGGYVITDLSSSAVTVKQSAANGGNGGKIQLTQTGDVVVQGDQSIGILAQSIGGGGGVVDRIFANTVGGSGSSGPVTIALNGNVQAVGDGSVGVFAQSRGTTGQGNISIVLAAEKQIKVSDQGVAVQLSGGARNSFVNNGSVIATSASGLPDGYAFKGVSGNESILNQPGATLVGNLNLGDGLNSLINENGASAVIGREVFIGNGPQQSFVNRGRVSPGGSSIYTTQITGNYAQTATGKLEVDLDLTNDSLDRLNITQQASLSGALQLKTRGITLIKPGQRNLVFASADGGITRQDLELNALKYAVVHYSIQSTDHLAFLDTNVDFAGFGQLNPNQTAIGNHINQIQLVGSSPELSPLLGELMNLSTLSQVADAYDRLSPEMYGSTQTNLQLSSQRFQDNLLSCQASKSHTRFIAEGQCVWFEGSTRNYSSNSTSDYFGFNSSNAAVSAGAQFDLNQGLFLGISAGHNIYETNFSGNIPSQIKGSSDQAGISIKKVFGATKVGLTMMGGYGGFDAQRPHIFPFNATASSTPHASFMGSQLRLSHDIKGSHWYLRPALSFGLSKVNSRGFQETGAGAQNLIVAESHKTYTTLSPSLEVGGEFKSGNLLIRPRLSTTYMHYLSDPSAAVFARLQGAPADAPSFKVFSLADRDSLSVAADISLLSQHGFAVDLGYWGQYSKNTSSNGGYLKMSFSF